MAKSSRVPHFCIAAALALVLIGVIVWALGAERVERPGGGLRAGGADVESQGAVAADIAAPVLLRNAAVSHLNREHEEGIEKHQLACRIVDYHVGVPIEGVEVTFAPVDGGASVIGVTDADGLVALSVEVLGAYAASVKSFGWVLSRSDIVVDAASASSGHSDAPVLRAIELFASGVKVNGPQPYDGVFEWDRPLQVVGNYGLDLQGLERNVAEARRIHGAGIQVYALAQHEPLTGMATLFFEHRGMVASQVTMRKLAGFTPTVVDLEGLPPSDGAAGYVIITIGNDEEGPQFGPFYLVREQPISGYRGTRLTSGARCPVPPGTYSLSGNSLTFPWMFPVLTSPSVVNCSVRSGEITRIQLDLSCRVRDCRVKVAAPGRHHAIIFGAVGDSGDVRWGGVTFSGADNAAQVVLPVGKVAWRRYYGPDKIGEVAEFEVPDGAGVYDVELRTP